MKLGKRVELLEVVDDQDKGTEQVCCYTVWKTVNTLEPALGAKLDKAQVQQLIDDGCEVVLTKG